MAIETPQIFTPVHQEEIYQDDKFQSFNEETYKKICLNNNWLIDLRPIGSILFVNINQEGSEIPDPSVWQECDGSEITNPNSPLRSIGAYQNFTPDMRDRYIKFADSEIGNPQGGSQNHNLAHNHTTGGPSSVGPGIEEKGDRRYRVSHTHSIASQYSNPTTLDSPAYVYSIAYMKIV
jgi:hypothetical protein